MILNENNLIRNTTLEKAEENKSFSKDTRSKTVIVI